MLRGVNDVTVEATRATRSANDFMVGSLARSSALRHFNSALLHVTWASLSHFLRTGAWVWRKYPNSNDFTNAMKMQRFCVERVARALRGVSVSDY